MKVALFANTDWYLYNFKLSLARKLRERGDQVIMLSPPGPYVEKIVGEGFEWRAVEMTRRSINPLREVFVIQRLRSVLKRDMPDVVHNFTIKCAVYGSLASKMSGVGTIVNSIAGLGFVFTSRKLLAITLKPFVKSLLGASLGGKQCVIIVQNPDDFSFFGSASWLNAQKLVLIKGSGVNIKRFVGKDRESVLERNRPLRVLLAARLLWDKGIKEFVDAATMLLKAGGNFEFYLAGTPDDGNPASVPAEVVKEWHRLGVVRWLGHVNDMPSLYSNVDVVTLPSYREGLPKSLIEAAACGLAIITTDAPGCREVVNESGKNGILVRVGSSKELAVAIRKLDDERNLCLELGRAARERALAEFDEEIVNSKTIDCYCGTS